MKLEKKDKLLGVFLFASFIIVPFIAAWAMVFDKTANNAGADFAWKVIGIAVAVVMVCFLVLARKSLSTYAVYLVQSRDFAIFTFVGVAMLATLAKIGLESIVSGNIPYGAAALLTYAIVASFGASVLYFCFLAENDKL